MTRFNKKQIPNLLTIFRIVLFIPVIVLVATTTSLAYKISLISIHIFTSINVSAGFLAGGILFVLLTATDWLDGYLARKWNCVSDFGKLWDPIADKVLINGLLITFAALNYVHFGIVIAFIIRDIVMDGLRIYAIKYQVLVAANIYGKLKTVFQMIACILTLFVFAGTFTQFQYSSSGLIWFWVGQMFFYWVALFFAFVSWAIYYFKIIKMVKLHNQLLISRHDSKLKS